jgi:hypothetical protein
MRFQGTWASCGPAALSAALEAVGVERTESELTIVCKTDGVKGTNWENLIKACRTVGKSESGVGGSPFEESLRYAPLVLMRALEDGHAVVMIVCSDEPWDHYVAAVGLLGRGPSARVLCFDPGANEPFVSRTLPELLAWWRGPAGVRKPYCGLIV